MAQASTAVEARLRDHLSAEPTPVANAGTHPAHWETSVWPLVIGLGILLLPLAFAFHFVYHMPLAAVVSLGVGAPLIVAGIVGWVREALGHPGAALGAPAMGWFILAEALIFLSFFASYWAVRLGAPSWPPAGTPKLPIVIPLLMTVILVSSSITIHVAEVKHENGDHHGFVRWLGLTMLLGIGFLGFSAFEWRELIQHGFIPATNIFGTMFFSITGFHAGHVFVGLAIFTAMLLPALVGKTYGNFITAGSLYWHFVDVIWLFVVSQVYFW
jgi:cytochrome c oxidase subunit 3